MGGIAKAVSGIFGGGGITGGGEPLGLPDPLDLWGGQASEAKENAQRAAELQANAAAEAARIQAAAAEKALAENKRQFDVSRSDQLPWLQSGGRALSKQEALTGLGGQEAQRQAYAQFEESPGQAWLRDQTMQGVLNQSAAIGGLGGGNVRRELQEHAAGLASQDFGNYYNRLAGISGTGQTTGAQLGQLGAQQSAQAGNLTNMAGQARASGVLGSGQAYAGGLQQQSQIDAQRNQNMLSGIGTIGGGVLAAFSDVDLKKNINNFTEKDLKECYDQVIKMDLYNWEYKDNTGLPKGNHIGPMYQEVNDNIKAEDRTVKALDMHKEHMLIAGALKYAKLKGVN